MNIKIDALFGSRDYNRLGIIQKLDKEDLLNMTEESVIRIIRIIGDADKQYSHDKYVIFPKDKRISNDYNAMITGFRVYKKKVYVDFKIWYSNSFVVDDDDFCSFMYFQDYNGAYHYKDRYGNLQKADFTFSKDRKAEALRSLLFMYHTWRCNH